jgi:hypothetical protein
VAATAPPEPTKPLSIKGAKTCTPQEVEQEWCVSRGLGGVCREGLCITVRECPSYCTAFVERQSPPLAEPEGCAASAECRRDTAMIRKSERANVAAEAARLNDVFCGQLRSMPPPRP